LTDAEGRYRIRCLPTGEEYELDITAPGRGRSRLEIQKSLRMKLAEMRAVELPAANKLIAGRVLDDRNAPIENATVTANGEGQPSSSVQTDGKGRFEFRVCEGNVNLFVNTPQGGFIQGGAVAGETNVMLQTGQNGVAGAGRINRTARPNRDLRKSVLPKLSGVNLPPDSIPKDKPLLICLFDAGQRSSRQMMKQLNDHATMLRGGGVQIVGVQAVVTGGEIFNQWRLESPVSFPVGRVTERTEATSWILDTKNIPYLILTDHTHTVVDEGFSIDDLEVELKKIPL
jgi:hypothetical protein